MTTTREAVLSAVYSALTGYAWADPAPLIERNPAETVKIPPGGVIAMDDGDPGAADRLLGAEVWGWTHPISLTAQVQDVDGAIRAAGLDRLMRGISAALWADPSFGGLVDALDLVSLQTMTESVMGGVPLASALITLELNYDTATPLG